MAWGRRSMRNRVILAIVLAAIALASYGASSSTVIDQASTPSSVPTSSAPTQTAVTPGTPSNDPWHDDCMAGSDNYSGYPPFRCLR